MLKQIIEISKEKAYLSIKDSQLRISYEDGREVRRPLEDIAMLICDHPSLTYSHRLLSELSELNVSFLICNDLHMPQALLHPFSSHSLHSKVLQIQLSAKSLLKERLWQTVIQEKIINQSRLLKVLHGNDAGLMAESKLVERGDKSNKEASTSKRYWNMLFSELDFRRNRFKEDINMHLNYGYSILRSAISRSIVSVGLHPALGIHHHNQYNAFALADDLMEPFRPLIDEISYRILQRDGSVSALRKEDKAELLSVLSQEFIWDKKTYPCLEALHHYAHSLVESFKENKMKLRLPKWQF